MVFTGVTQGKFDSIVAKAAAAGITIKGNAGEVSHLAFAMKWQFDPATGVFIIRCTRRPFVISCATINGRINELMGLAQPDQTGTSTQSFDLQDFTRF
jgi:hypothetical protein